MRYVFFDPSLKFSPSIPVGFAGGMFYLSTIGDLGVSVFQIVGLVQEQINNVVGMETAALTYAVRLLPGPFFANRPGPDFFSESDFVSIPKGFFLLAKDRRSKKKRNVYLFSGILKNFLG